MQFNLCDQKIFFSLFFFLIFRGPVGRRVARLQTSTVPSSAPRDVTSYIIPPHATQLRFGTFFTDNQAFMLILWWLSQTLEQTELFSVGFLWHEVQGGRRRILVAAANIHGCKTWPVMLLSATYNNWTVPKVQSQRTFPKCRSCPQYCCRRLARCHVGLFLFLPLFSVVHCGCSTTYGTMQSVH